MPPSCTCVHPDALPWIRDVFKECVSTSTELLGFYLALISLACWISAQWPQFVAHFRARRARGLSPWFLIQWLAGDAFNLIGCIATGDQTPTQAYTAVYFVCSDVALLAQYSWYEGASDDASASADTGASEDERDGEDEIRTPLAGRRRSSRAGLGALGAVAAVAAVAAVEFSVTRAASGSGALRAVASAVPVSDCAYNDNPPWVQNFGRFVGYLAMMFYLGGRAAQIVKNSRRRSVEGLSLTMFALAICANVTYGLSIICASHSKENMIRSLPWLGGSFGTVACDIAILAQSVAFGRRNTRALALNDGDDGDLTDDDI